MKRKIWAICLVAVLMFSCVALFASCAPEAKPITATFRDITGVEEWQYESKDGKIVKPLQPSKEGYTFVDWYADSSFNDAGVKTGDKFDFAKVYTEDVEIYSYFTKNLAGEKAGYTLIGGISEYDPNGVADGNGCWSPDVTPLKWIMTTKDNLSYSVNINLTKGDAFKVKTALPDWDTGAVNMGGIGLKEVKFAEGVTAIEKLFKEETGGDNFQFGEGAVEGKIYKVQITFNFAEYSGDKNAPGKCVTITVLSIIDGK
ncbi:MAG: InlB B-repeat-containing protein [Clostridia bacterium]